MESSMTYALPSLPNTTRRCASVDKTRQDDNMITTIATSPVLSFLCLTPAPSAPRRPEARPATPQGSF